MSKAAAGCSGCALFLGLILLAIGGAAYWFLSPIWKSFQEFEQIGQLNQEIQNQSPFTPPADKSLTEDQVRALVEVQRSMYENITSRFEEIREKVREIEEKAGPDGQVGVFEAVRLVRSLHDAIGMIRQAKIYQVQALNDQGLSLAEYEFIRNTVVASVGGGNILNFTELRENLMQGQGLEMEDPQLSREQIEANLAVIAPFREQLDETIGLAFLGL